MRVIYSEHKSTLAFNEKFPSFKPFSKFNVHHQQELVNALKGPNSVYVWASGRYDH